VPGIEKADSLARLTASSTSSHDVIKRHRNTKIPW